MAGRQKPKRIVTLLGRLAEEELDLDSPNALDYAVAWLADGKTVQQLADHLTKLAGEPVHRGWLTPVLLKLAPNAEQQMNDARRRSSHALVEDAQAIVDTAAAEPTREGIAAAKVQADIRTWRAARYDRETFGDKATHAVEISLGDLHLDALRQRAARQQEIQAKATLALPNVTASASQETE